MAMVAAGILDVIFSVRQCAQAFRILLCVGTVLISSACTQERTNILLSDQDVVEGNEQQFQVEIPVKLDRPATQPFSLNFTTRALSAEPGRDFDPIDGVLHFQSGQSQETIRVTIHGDRLHGPDRVFAVMLEPQDDAPVRVLNPQRNDNLLLVSIRDDDTTPVAGFVTPGTRVTETAGSLRIRVMMSVPSDHDVRLGIQTRGTADELEDYLLPSGRQVVVPAGATEISFDLLVLDDRKTECPEWLELSLLPETGVEVGEHGSIRIRIEDEMSGRRRLQVGSGAEYPTPSAAAAAAQSGDMIEIAAGTYRGDVAVWHQNDLLICGDEGGVVLDADGKSAGGKGIWVIKGNRVTVEHITFQNAHVRDRNGAGIRFEAGELAVRHSRFIHNENGILTGNKKQSVLRVEHCSFIENGAGDGYSHNLYVGKIARLELRYSELRGAVVGHNVKSRARESIIQYNWIMDAANGRASYQVDLSNGGSALLIGNLIQQGSKAENYVLVSFGAEKMKHENNTLLMVNNTLVNDRNSGVFVRAPDGARVRLINNIFAGKGTLNVKGAEQKGNIMAEDPGFLGREDEDYRLSERSPAINAGVDPGEYNGMMLRPKYEYIRGVGVWPRPSYGAIDAGAFESSFR